MIILYIGLVMIGLLMIVRPSVFWTLTESWKVYNEDAEPSILYVISTRLGGVMFTLAGLGGIITSFML